MAATCCNPTINLDIYEGASGDAPLEADGSRAGHLLSWNRSTPLRVHVAIWHIPGPCSSSHILTLGSMYVLCRSLDLLGPAEAKQQNSGVEAKDTKAQCKLSFPNLAGDPHKRAWIKSSAAALRELGQQGTAQFRDLNFHAQSLNHKRNKPQNSADP